MNLNENMLYLIGLGIDEKDISLKGVDALNACSELFFETYTSIWNGDVNNIEKIAGKPIKLLKREDVESDFLVKKAEKNDIALLVPGDPLAATTHFELVLEAKRKNIEIIVVHAASIQTSIAETGLQLYKFGRATTLPFASGKYSPTSPLEVIKENQKSGLHSLILLDIGMTATQGLEIMKNEFQDKKFIAACRLGFSNSTIKYGSAEELCRIKEINVSPAVLILPGKLHFKEEEALELWK